MCNILILILNLAHKQTEEPREWGQIHIEAILLRTLNAPPVLQNNMKAKGGGNKGIPPPGRGKLPVLGKKAGQAEVVARQRRKVELELLAAALQKANLTSWSHFPQL